MALKIISILYGFLSWSILVMELMADISPEQDEAFDAMIHKYPAKNQRRFPIPSHLLPLKVSMRLKLIAFDGIDDLNEEMAFVGLTILEWTDPLLQWQNKCEDCYFKVTPEEIWTPSLVHVNHPSNIYNLFEKGKVSKPFVHPDLGFIQWLNSGRFATKCQLDFFYFPFDQQICTLIFQDWDFLVENLLLVPALNHPNVTFIDDDLSRAKVSIDSQMWRLTNAKGLFFNEFHKEANVTFSTAKFTFTVERKPLYFVFIIVNPVAMVSILQMIGQFQAHGEGRSQYFMVLLLTFWVIQQGKFQFLFMLFS